jgi:uncharacterized protein YbaP (TraB family)
MKYRFLFAVISILAGFLLFVPSELYAQSSVWEISKNGNTLYLGGSVHILREEDFPLPAEFDLAFDKSSILVLETDVDKMAEPAYMQYLITQMILPGGKTLETILSAEAYSLLKEKCELYGLPFETVSIFKPAMITTILTVLEIQANGFVQQGVDNHYLEKAKKEKKALDFLEPIETQINLLVSMGEGYENDYVIYSLEDLENSTENTVTIVSEWRRGNTAFTEESIVEMKKSWPIFYKALLLDRNNAWMHRLEEFLETAPVEFVIAGFAHMPGPDGLLTQLEKSGCKVKQLTIGDMDGAIPSE